MEEINVLIRNIGIISRNNNVLSGMIGGAPEVAQLREQRVVIQDTGQLARETGERLMALHRSEMQAMQSLQQRTLLVKLNKDFEHVLHRFRELAKQSGQQSSSVSSPAPITIRDREGERDENERSGLLSSQQWQQQGQHQQEIREARRTEESLAERERMVEQIEQTTGDINEIVSELAVLISSQSEGIDHISAVIENTADQTARARDELHTAAGAQTRRVSRKGCIIFTVALLALLYLSNLFGRYR